MQEVKVISKVDTTIYQLFTEATAETWDKEQTYLDNVEYQREDMQAAYKLLNTPWTGGKTYPPNSRYVALCRADFLATLCRRSVACFSRPGTYPYL